MGPIGGKRTREVSHGFGSAHSKKGGALLTKKTKRGIKGGGHQEFLKTSQVEIAVCGCEHRGPAKSAHFLEKGKHADECQNQRLFL